MLEVEKDEFEKISDRDYYFRVKIVRSMAKEIQIRQVIGIMQFLGDAGGIYSSVFMIGAAVNLIFSGKDSSLQLIKHHFIVNNMNF